MSTEENEDFSYAFDRGVDHFNQVEFVDAEEAFEEAADASDGNDKALSKTISELAAAYHKVREGFPEGVMKILARIDKQLQSYPDEVAGIDVAALLKGIRDTEKELMRGHDYYEDDLPDDHFPRITRVAGSAEDSDESEGNDG